jgi:hypothetical protein
MLLPIVDDGTFIIFPDMFAIFVDRMEFHNGHRCMKGPGSRNLPLLVVDDSLGWMPAGGVVLEVGCTNSVEVARGGDTTEAPCCSV